MKNVNAVLFAGVVAVLPLDAASACRVPRRPVEPLYQHFDAAAFATVSRAEGAEVTVEIDSFMRGAADKRRFRLSFAHPAGSCGPGGPRAQRGEKLVLYFLGQGVARWDRPAALVAKDPYVEASLAKVRPERRRVLLRRAAEVLKFKGPVPLTDASKWTAPYPGDLGWTASSSSITRARLQVSDDGGVASCHVFLATKPSERDKLVCDSLKRHGRFKPPLLSQERQRSFEVRWDEASSQSAS